MADYEIDNIIMAGIVFVVYLAIAIMVFFVLSGPVDALFDSIDAGAQLTDAAPYMDQHLPYLRQGVNIAFALGIAFPATWFIFWVFSRDPDISFYRLR